MIKFINNKMESGIDYDYSKINAEYKKLKCPKDYYNPTHIPFHRAKYYHILSSRGTGKTNNVLLWCMCARKVHENYPVLVYIRQRIDMIMPKNLSTMFNVIVENGYVEKLTDGKYNNIFYKARKFYYCKTDDDGNVIDQDPRHFMVCLSLDKHQDIKSSLSEPYGDFVILDEYISDYYNNDFIRFMDTLSTVLRDRMSGHIFMLANTIEKNSVWFREFEIYDEVQYINFGENRIIESNLGTNVYVEVVKSTEGKEGKQKVSQKLYFGFSNPLLASITGSCVWAIKNYPHIPSLSENDSLICNNRFIDNYGRLLKLELWNTENLGFIVLVHNATKLYDDSVIYTLNDITDNRMRCGIGYSKLDKFIFTLYTRNKFYYATNEVGEFFNNYLKQVKRR